MPVLEDIKTLDVSWQVTDQSGSILLMTCSSREQADSVRAQTRRPVQIWETTTTRRRLV